MSAPPGAPGAVPGPVPGPVRDPAPGTLIFAGGGSGGHIYPGLAIAEEVVRTSLQARRQPPAIVFVCSDRPLDAQILSHAGARFLASPAKPLIARPRGMLRFMTSWGPSVRQARELIGASRAAGPVHIVAMGGFVAAPFVQGARAERCPVTMVNLDAIPGKANRWIAPRVSRVFSAAVVPSEHRPRTRPPAPDARPTWIEIPPIVRDAARACVQQSDARRRLGLDPSRPVLIVTGGSQGLRSLNEFVAAFAASREGRAALAAGSDRAWQVLHQTGRAGEEAARAAYAAAGVDATVVPFTNEMGLWWSGADAAVCTAGAGTVAEVWMSATPALMLPYPHHRDQHQKFNALALERAGGVIIGIDRIDPPLNLQSNGDQLLALLTDAPRREKIRAALRALGPADGASRVARALLDALSGVSPT